MGQKRIHINEFEKILLKDLEEWKDVTIEDIREKVEKHGKELRKEVKKNSPERTGEYKKSWRIRFEGLNTAHFKSLIYNKDHYRLTHLLEHGHAKKNGGRTKAFPHLLEAEEKQTEEFIKDVERLFK